METNHRADAVTAVIMVTRHEAELLESVVAGMDSLMELFDDLIPAPIMKHWKDRRESYVAIADSFRLNIAAIEAMPAERRSTALAEAETLLAEEISDKSM